MVRLGLLIWFLFLHAGAVAQTTHQPTPPPAPKVNTPPKQAAPQPVSPAPVPAVDKKPWHHHPILPSALGLMGTVLTAVIALKAFRGTLAFNRQKHQEDTENALRKHAADAESNIAKQRADRDLAIRKDIYFSIHAAATEAIFQVVAILNRHIPVEAAHEAMRKLAIEITKYQAVAGKEAMDAAFTLQEVIAEAFTVLIPSRMHIERLVESRDRIQKRVEELMARSTAASGNERMQANEELTHVQGDLDTEADAVRKCVVAHYEAMQVWMQKIQQPQINFIMLARRELGLELDEAWFQQRRDGILQRALQRLQNTGL
jgi:hypothetical protein